MRNYSIDRDTYSIPKNNYYTEIFNKSLIILGSTNRAKNNYLIRLLNKKYTKEWNTYTITRDGIIYEHYNPLYYSDFMRDNIIDRKSVSILLENMGHLYYSSDTDCYVNDLNEIYKDKPYEKEWRGYKTYEPYTKEQYNATVFLCRLLCLELNINDDTFGHNVKEDSIKNYNGVVSRSNYDVNYTDLNPSFDFIKFLKDLKK